MARRRKEDDPRPLVHLEVEGKRVPAREGEPLTAALLASGMDILSRGVKYHRARGPYCLVGRCAHCLMRVDGEPNVAACLVRVRDGMRVERQNAFPSVNVDVFTTIDWMYPRGLDHHSLFPGVPVVEKVVARVARHMAGLGTLPETAHTPEARYLEHEAEVLVVGGGPAGLAAALEAARAGAKTTLIEDQAELGAGLLAPLLRGGPDASWREETLRALVGSGARLLPSSFVFGLFREGSKGVPWAAAKAPHRGLLVVRPRALVLATGANELLPLFPNNELPGIYGARALATLIERDGVVPGERALVVGDGPEAAGIADRLREAGCEVVGVVGLGPGPQGHIVRARGRGSLAGAILQMPDGSEKRIRVDLMAISDHRSGFVDLARHAGAEIRFGEAGFAVVADDVGATRIPGVFACGEVRGRCTTEEAIRQGAAAGRAAAAFVIEEAA